MIFFCIKYSITLLMTLLCEYSMKRPLELVQLIIAGNKFLLNITVAKVLNCLLS